MFVFLSKKPNYVHGDPHMISYPERRNKDVCSGKPPLGPSVTVSCWSAVQDGLHTHTRARTETYSPLLLLRELGKPACPMWCFNRSAKSGLCEPYTELSLIFSLCHCAPSCAGGQYLLSQQGEVKPGHNQPEIKPMGCIWEFNRDILEKSQICQSVKQSRVCQFPHLGSQNSINSLSLLHSFNLFERH